MRRLVGLIVLFFAVPAFPQQLTLSNQAEISLITLGPDQDDLVQAFGHSAVRVVDSIRRMDIVFNYGVFSFDQPNFYLNFARGHNYYYVGIASYQDFKEVYIYYNRYVHEQVLDLTQVQKQQIFDYLQWNAQPENRNYLYDYFFNNCSTKIRDVFADQLKGEIQFDGTFIQTDYTIRELTDPYMKSLPWGDLGIDIGLGSPIDRKATSYEYMYLPEHLESAFDHAYMLRQGNRVPLVKSKVYVFINQPKPPEKSLIRPWGAFGALLVITIGLSLMDLRRKKISVWFDAILYSSIGLLGIVLLLLWTATDHHACARNLNLLWALPTHLIAVIFIVRKNKPRWLRLYFLGVAAVCLVLLVLWPVLPQLLSYFLIPVVATLGLRSFTIFKLLPVAA